MDLEIKYVPIKSLRTYANNAKIHTGDQVEQIKASIQEFGFNDPIAVDRDGEIIEGHGRYIAATELGLDEVPVIELRDLSDEQRRAYMLVHNKLTMDTGFDYDLLMMELEDISVDMDKYGLEIEEEDYSYNIVNKEYDAGDFDDEKFKYECPECGFKFNA